MALGLIALLLVLVNVATLFFALGQACIFCMRMARTMQRTDIFLLCLLLAASEKHDFRLSGCHAGSVWARVGLPLL